MGSTGFSKYIWGGAKVFMNSKPKLMPLDIDPYHYDEIFIGTPVWAWTYSPAIKTLLEDNYFSEKKVYFFCTHEGGLGKTIDKAKTIIEKKNTYVGSIDFENVKKNPKEQIIKAINWVKTL
ncbi:MAG: flavodoxin, partial [Bacilli bacterium]|nr:flavodoxin [Bacilli bacterium]